jgi:hypothetical protein
VGARSKFMRTLAVVLAAIAVFVFICPDDVWELDALGQGEVVLHSLEGLPTHRNASVLLAPLGRDICSPTPKIGTTPLTFVPHSTCALRC